MAKKKKSNRGAPTKHKEEYNEMAYKLTLLGYRDEDLAKFFNVDVSTINNWKNAHPEFLESVNRGKDLADAEVAESMHKRAKGYDYEEVHSKKVFLDENKEVEATVEKIIKKHVPGDVGAQKNWLANRQRRRWSESKVELNVKKEELTDEELDAKIAEYKKRNPDE